MNYLFDIWMLSTSCHVWHFETEPNSYSNLITGSHETLHSARTVYTHVELNVCATNSVNGVIWRLCFCCLRFCYLGCVVFFALPIARFDSLPIGEVEQALVPPPSVWCEFIFKRVIRLYNWEPFACSRFLVCNRWYFAAHSVRSKYRVRSSTINQPTNRPIDRTEPTNQPTDKQTQIFSIEFEKCFQALQRNTKDFMSNFTTRLT